MWRRRSTALFFALICAGFLLVVIIVTSSSEPRYKGQRYTYWISVLEQPNSGAKDAIRYVGTNGIPQLLNLIDYRSSGLDVVRALIGYLSGSKTAEPWETSRNAVTAFGILGTNAASAIPILLERARNQPGSLTPYPRALAGIGSPVLPAIRPYLTSSDLYMQFVAIRTLAEMADQDDLRHETSRAFPTLVKLLANTSDESWDGRNAALDLMQRFPLQPELAVPALIEVLDEKNDHLRGKATAMLGVYETTAAEALTKLSAMHNAALVNEPREAASIQQVIQKIEKASNAQGKNPGR